MYVKLIVHEQNGVYYATRTFPSNTIFKPENIIFVIERDIDPDEWELMENKAREEARRRGIHHVINLDQGSGG